MLIFNMETHFICVRCGTILIGYPSKPLPSFCPRCGGVDIHNIGKEGEYTPKEVRKEYGAPFRADLFFRKPIS